MCSQSKASSPFEKEKKKEGKHQKAYLCSITDIMFLLIRDDPSVVAMPPPLTPEQYAALPHDNAGPKLNAIIWTLNAVSGVFLGLRLYCKIVRIKGLWWDDIFLAAAWVRNSSGIRYDERLRTAL